MGPHFPTREGKSRLNILISLSLSFLRWQENRHRMKHSNEASVIIIIIQIHFQTEDKKDIPRLQTRYQGIQVRKNK